MASAARDKPRLVGVPERVAFGAILDRSPLASISGASRTALLDLARLERLRRRKRLIQQGEVARSLWVLGAGRVRVERVSEGRRIPLGDRGPGQLVGETSLAGGPADQASVEDEGEALVVPMSGARKLLTLDPGFRSAALAALLQSQLEAQARLEALLLYGVEARLVRFLLAAHARWGVGDRIGATYTHAEIAGLVGSTRETITLLLGKLRRAGLLAFEGRRILIPDRAGLERHLSGA